jgi:hypothetical protein
MSSLEDLIGRPLDQISDEELEEIVKKGRLAREEESPKKKAAKAKKEPGIPKGVVLVDLDDLDDLD